MIHTGHIATNLRRIRKATGMSRQKVADAANIHNDTLKNMENGKDHTLSSLFSVLEVLEYTVVEFFILCEEESSHGA